MARITVINDSIKFTDTRIQILVENNSTALVNHNLKNYYAKTNSILNFPSKHTENNVFISDFSVRFPS